MEAGKTLSVLLGLGSGSMYTVRHLLFFDEALFLFIFLFSSPHFISKTCSGDSKVLAKLTSANLAGKPATDLKYNFYNIDNPKEYLDGSDAVVVEQGPYNLR